MVYQNSILSQKFIIKVWINGGLKKQRFKRTEVQTNRGSEKQSSILRITYVFILIFFCLFNNHHENTSKHDFMTFLGREEFTDTVILDYSWTIAKV